MTNEGELIPCQSDALKFSDGFSCSGQVLLRMPVVLEHVIEDESPLASWRQGTSSMMMDAEFDIVVTVSFVWRHAALHSFAWCTAVLSWSAMSETEEQLTFAGAFWLLACCLAAGCLPWLSLDLSSQTGSGLGVAAQV